jgi:hypothetical protein
LGNKLHVTAQGPVLAAVTLLHVQVSFQPESAIPAMLNVQDFFLNNEVRTLGSLSGFRV